MARGGRSIISRQVLLDEITPVEPEVPEPEPEPTYTEFALHPEYLIDGLHPNDVGYAWMAEDWRTRIGTL